MKKTFRTAISAVVAAALLALALNSGAAEKTLPSTGDKGKGAATPTKATRYPITGKISDVNKVAKTFSIKGAEKDRVFKVNAQTKITKHGKPATLADAVVGEEVGGYVEKQTDGSVVVLSVRFGPKPEEDRKDKEPAKKDPTPIKPAAPKAK